MPNKLFVFKILIINWGYNIVLLNKLQRSHMWPGHFGNAPKLSATHRGSTVLPKFPKPVSEKVSHNYKVGSRRKKQQKTEAANDKKMAATDGNKMAVSDDQKTASVYLQLAR